MKYQDWEASVPEILKQDRLWKAEAYRLALFAADIGWQDVTRPVKDPRTRSLADQLFRSLGSISANIAEGYSRGTSRDRSHFCEYALGSAREARDWYFKGRHVVEEAVVDHRMQLLTQIIRILLVMIPRQRGTVLREESGAYVLNGTIDGTPGAES